MKTNAVELAPSDETKATLPISSIAYGEADDVAIIEDTSFVRRGDREVYEFLFLQYKDKIVRYQYGLVRDVEVAQDLEQKTFMRAWEKFPTLKDKSRFLPWLYTIARNVVYDYWRSRKNVILISWENLSEQQSAMIISGPEAVIEMTEIVRLALAALTPKYRDCLLLYAVYGFSKEEIARFVGISKESVTTYLCSARSQFRQAYDRLKRE